MGRLDVDGVLAELSAAQIREWEAFAELEPFGMTWHQTALLAQQFANANRDTDAHPEPFTIEDFLPVEPQDEAVSVETDLSTDSIADSRMETDDEPPWKRWKAAFQIMADASAPSPSPSLK